MVESAVLAKVNIVNAALVELGQPQSYTHDAETELGGIVDAVWPNLEAFLCAAYDFTYFRSTRALAALATPSNGWAYGYQLWADRIGDPLAILSQVSPSERYHRSFMLEGGNVYTDIAQAWARYRVAGDPRFWDGGFRAAFTLALAGKLAVPIVQDEDLAAAKLAQAWGSPRENFGGGLFGKLISNNRAAQPQGRGFMDDDPLTAARWG